MGMFDTVLLKCPHCGEVNYEQTKVGECLLLEYTEETIQNDLSILSVFSNRPIQCEHCNEKFILCQPPIPKCWIEKYDSVKHKQLGCRYDEDEDDDN